MKRSFYNKAHERATPQTDIYETMYDKYNKITDDFIDAIRSVYQVKNYKDEIKTIQIQNYEK